jgi:hypothetical protein
MTRFTGTLLAAVVLVALQPGTAQALPTEGSSPAACDAVDLERNLAEDPLPVAALAPCPGIRPGAGAVIDGTTGCTLNFVFRGTTTAADGTVQDRGLHIGIAGHCVFDAGSAPTTWAPGEGPEVADSAGGHIGHAVFGVHEGNYDFAIIEIDDAREASVNPAVCHFGGPTGMAAPVRVGDLLHHFGQGLLVGDTVPGRSGVASPVEAPDMTVYAGNAIFGDSGSPLINASGAAVAVVVAILPPLVFSSNIDVGVGLAEDATGVDFTLQTAQFAA